MKSKIVLGLLGLSVLLLGNPLSTHTDYALAAQPPVYSWDAPKLYDGSLYGKEVKVIFVKFQVDCLTVYHLLGKLVCFLGVIHDRLTGVVELRGVYSDQPDRFILALIEDPDGIPIYNTGDLD